MDPLSLVVGCGIGIAIIAFLLFGFMIIRPWRRMVFCGGQESMLALVGMRLRGHPVSMIVDAYLTLLHSGAIISLADVEAHYVANQSRIVSAGDLVNSIREDPVGTRVIVWLEADDAEWLGTRLSEYASALPDELDRNANAESGQRESDSQLSIEAERYERIAERVNGAVAKIKRAQTHAHKRG